MRNSRAAFIVAILTFSSVLCSSQSPPPTTPAPVAQPAPLAPSAILQPALDTVRQTLDTVPVIRWKRGTIRDEATDNITDLLHDMEVNVPPLLQAADADPGAISKVLPVSRHINALYDVLLRVVQGARVSAPGEQVLRLQKALVTLGDSRIALENQLQQAAVAQEKQLVDLHHSMQEQTAALEALKSAPPVPCKPPEKKVTHPTTHRKRKAPVKTPAPAVKPSK